MNRRPVRDPRKPYLLAAGLVVVLTSGLVTVGDAAARTMSYTTVQRGTVTATAGAAGNVQSADTRQLVFGTSGTVTKIEVAPGDEVRSGTVLARLDDTDARAQVDVAKAALAAAQDTYAKAEEGICAGSGGGSSASAATPASYDLGPAPAHERGPRPTRTRSSTPTPTPTPTLTTASPTPKPTPSTTSPTPTPTTPRPTRSPSPTGKPKPTARPKPSGGAGPGQGGRSGQGGNPSGAPGGAGGGCQANSVELASASVTKAEVNVRDAERTLSATKLTAPMDGTVLAVGGAVGDQVSNVATSGFITLGDLTDLQVQAMFPLGEVNQLKIGQKTTIGLGMLPGHQYQGTVTRIDPAATTSGNRALFGVMISLDDPPAGLRSGMSASVEVVTAQTENTLYVPADAVHPKSDGTGTVLIRRSGQTTSQTVRLGVRSDRYVAIASGLALGDQVVLPSGTGPDGFPSDAFPTS